MDLDLDEMDDEVFSDLESTYLQDWSLQDYFRFNSSTHEDEWRMSLSPSNPFDEFAMDFEKDDCSFGPPLTDDEPNTSSSFPFEKRFEVEVME